MEARSLQVSRSVRRDPRYLREVPPQLSFSVAMMSISSSAEVVIVVGDLGFCFVLMFETREEYGNPKVLVETPAEIKARYKSLMG